MRGILYVFLLGLTLSTFAQKEVYIPRSFSNVDWSWERSYESENFVVFWGPTVGDNPITYTDSNLSFDPAVVTGYLEDIYDRYIQEYGFIEETDSLAKYKVIVVMNETWGPDVFTGWAFGGSYDDVIASMWVHPRAATTDGWVLAHELTHSFQGQNYIQTNTDGGGFINSNKVGFFWECHANFMATHIYPENAAIDMARWTATRNFHWSSTRHHYLSFRMLYTLEELYGIEAVNDLWHHSNPGETPLAALKRLQGWDQDQLNDFMWEFARREVNADYPLNGWGEAIRAERQRIRTQNPEFYWRNYTILDKHGIFPDRYVVPEEIAPQDYGINLIRLFPNSGSETIKIKFKGHAETNTYTGWRYGVVAVNSLGTRFGEMHTASDAEFEFPIESGDTQWVLVVMGTPSQINEYPWEIGYPKIYRNPYEVRIVGAKPYGHQPNFRQEFKPPGSQHLNGGGWVANTATVAGEAYVGPNALVTGSSSISGDTRVEDYAWVHDATLSQKATISGKARVIGGSYSGSAQVTDYAVLNYANVNGSATVGGMALAWNSNYGGDVTIGGDAELGSCSVSGVYLQVPHPENGRTACDGAGASHVSNQDVNASLVPFDDALMLFEGEEMPATPLEASGSSTGSLKIAPCPVDGPFEITYPDQNIQEIAIYNLTGQLVFEEKAVRSHDLEVNGNNFPSGTYIVKILTTSGTILTNKFIKK